MFATFGIYTGLEERDSGEYQNTRESVWPSCKWLHRYFASMGLKLDESTGCLSLVGAMGGVPMIFDFGLTAMQCASCHSH